MNRENKRRTFEKGYYKTHPCHDSFCGRDFSIYTAVDRKVIVIRLLIVIFVGVIVIM